MKIITGIASTTHVDLHDERMAKEALDSMASQINSKYIRTNVEHDLQRQVGVVLYGEVCPLADGEFALLIVAGLLENEKEVLEFRIGESNNVSEKFRPYLAEVREEVKNRPTWSAPQNPLKKPRNIADMLESHLDSTAIWEDGSVYKIKNFIASIGDLGVHVYRDHNPPHFHVISKQRGIDARFHLETLELIDEKAGSVNSKDKKKIKDFFERNPDILKKLRDEHDRMQA